MRSLNIWTWTKSVLVVAVHNRIGDNLPYRDHRVSVCGLCIRPFGGWRFTETRVVGYKISRTHNHFRSGVL